MTDLEEKVKTNKEKRNIAAKLKRKQNAIYNSNNPVDPKTIERKCSGKCKKTKFLTEFKRDIGKAHPGYDYICKECRSNDDKIRKKIADEKKKTLDLTKVKKICCGTGGCGEEKPLTEFNNCGVTKDGFANLCRDCRKIIRRENLNENPKKEGTKYCTQCEKNLNVTEFNKDKFSKDGYQTVCKFHQLLRWKTSASKIEGFLKKLIVDAIGRCKSKSKFERGLTVEINYEFILKLYLKQERRCEITQKLMTYNKLNDRNDESLHIMNPDNISLDRIDSSKGYTRDNVRLICASVNKIKWTMSDEKLKVMCFNVITTNKLKNIDELRSKKINTGKKIEKDIAEDVYSKLRNFCSLRMNQTRGNAKVRDLEVKIATNDVINKYFEQNGVCALSGMILTFDNEESNEISDLSIDRIDSNKGYTYNNIQIVSSIVNKSKSDLKNEEYIRLCEEIYYGIRKRDFEKVLRNSSLKESFL